MRGSAWAARTRAFAKAYLMVPTSCQFGHGCIESLGVETRIMPAIGSFHEGDSLSLDRVRHNALRSRSRIAKHLAHGHVKSSFIVAVHFTRRQSKGGELVGNTSKAHHFTGAAHRLIPIRIDNHDQIGKPEMAREQQAFPDGAFIHLAVAHDHEAALAGPFSLGSEGQTNSYREAVSKRAGCHFQTRDVRLG